MPFGAHETMETQEILSEKINMITHFNLYARTARNAELRDMLNRHLQAMVMSYNELQAYTHDYNQYQPVPANTIMNAMSQQINYGLRNPAPMAPQADSVLSDEEIGFAMLCFHKNGARNASWAALECTDPTLRQMLMNSASNCSEQAYETFLLLNRYGLYQVPTMSDHTAKTLLHRYQPADQGLQTQYNTPSAQTYGQTYGQAYGQMSGGQSYNGMQSNHYANALNDDYETTNSTSTVGSEDNEDSSLS